MVLLSGTKGPLSWKVDTKKKRNEQISSHMRAASSSSLCLSTGKVFTLHDDGEEEISSFQH